MENLVAGLNSIIWSNALIILCLGAGIFFSVILRFPQVRYFKEMLRLLFVKSESDKGVSSFQAFAISLSGRIGTGNIAGVATAIAMGGPGALFWMWVIAFLGSSSAFMEATLGQVYKEIIDGEYRGGPSYYIAKGLGMKTYAFVFAVATILAMSFFLPGVQSNSIALALENSFSLNPYYSAIIVCILLALVIFGGIKRIGKVAEIVVPFMAGGYILMALYIIGANFTKIPEVFRLIFSSAFGQEQVFAGIIGMAISWGVKRGIYSNEAGQGSAPHAAAAAETNHPAKQGLVQAFSVYVDTLFVCTATGLMILFTDSYHVLNVDGSMLVEKTQGLAIGVPFTQNAVNIYFPSFGSGFVSVALFFFAFTTLIAYYYIAETNVSYLFEHFSGRKYLIFLLRLLTIFSVFYGSVKTATLAWGLGDIGVGLMAWLNIIAILLLQKKGLAVFKDYERQRKSGKDPDFKAENVGIYNTDCWK